MFISKLMNQDSGPVLEQMLQFTSARHKMLAENIANIDTPGYKQKDLSVEKFEEVMQSRMEQRDRSAAGSTNFNDVRGEEMFPTDGMLSHDGNNRSVEKLMSEFAKNALMHNMAVEMLRKQYSQMDMALKEKAG